MSAAVRLERWSAADHDLLAELNGDEAQMAHVGGAESPEKIAERQARYVVDPGQFRIVEETTGTGVGWVGFWVREWRGETVYEIGWAVIPAFQGRGIAAEATRAAIALAREDRSRRFLHAFPGVDNGASNALCRKLGFALLGALEFEYPKGHLMQCNDWRLALY
jgi:RimJ/RimL family protein N-acetyltransferase